MMEVSFTVIGARGYIGSRLCRHLDRQGAAPFAVDRFDANCHTGRNLGHVIYAGGVTADFRTRPFDTITAHVGAVAEILQRAEFASFLYLSSTRVYQGAARAAEDAELRLSTTDPLQLYNASKMAGEALCLALPETTERLSHGEPTWFIGGKKTFVTFANHHHDDRVAFWCAAPEGAQAALVDADPGRFFVPPYVGYRGWLGVYLDVPVDWEHAALIVEDAYRVVAPKRLLALLIELRHA